MFMGMRVIPCDYLQPNEICFVVGNEVWRKLHIQVKGLSMEIDELLEELRALHGPQDIVVAHMKADDLLLGFIANAEVTEAFEKIEKWYA